MCAEPVYWHGSIDCPTRPLQTTTPSPHPHVGAPSRAQRVATKSGRTSPFSLQHWQHTQGCRAHTSHPTPPCALMTHTALFFSSIEVSMLSLELPLSSASLAARSWSSSRRSASLRHHSRHRQRMSQAERVTGSACHRQGVSQAACAATRSYVYTCTRALYRAPRPGNVRPHAPRHSRGVARGCPGVVLDVLKEACIGAHELDGGGVPGDGAWDVFRGDGGCQAAPEDQQCCGSQHVVQRWYCFVGPDGSLSDTEPNKSRRAVGLVGLAVAAACSNGAWLTCTHAHTRQHSRPKSPPTCPEPS